MRASNQIADLLIACALEIKRAVFVTSAQFVDDVRLELGAIAPVEKSDQELCRLAITQRRQ